jgi:hypothetical protein
LAKDNVDLKARYQTYIATLERLDAAALVAARGRKISELEWMEKYQATILGDGSGGCHSVIDNNNDSITLIIIAGAGRTHTGQLKILKDCECMHCFCVGQVIAR